MAKKFQMHYETSELITYSYTCEVEAKNDSEARSILFKYFNPKTTLKEKQNMPIGNHEIEGESQYDHLTEDVMVMLNQFALEGNTECIVLNGMAEIEPELDLFEHREHLSSSANIIVNYYLDQLEKDDIPQPQLMTKFHSDLSELGYTFEWGLDMVPYGLTKK
jgi:hypothetical protein